MPSPSLTVLDVSLPDEAKLMDFSNILVEPGIATYILKHVLIATTVNTVLHDNHAVVEIMNISLTVITIYGDTKSGEFIPQVNRITACRITTAVTLPTNFVY